MSTITRTQARIPSVESAAVSRARRAVTARTSLRLRRVAWLAGAAAATPLLAACGSSPGQPTPVTTVTQTVTASASPPAQPTQPATQAPTNTPAPPATSPPATGTAGGSAMCRTSALRITINVAQANGAAGSTYYPLEFTNTSVTPCQMYGYPGVSFAAAPASGGKQIGAAAQRSGAFSAVAVQLAPGGTAHAWLRVSNAGNYPAATCHPVTAHYLRVYPPGETAAGYVSHAFDACTSASAAILTILPVRGGPGAAGVTP